MATSLPRSIAAAATLTALILVVLAARPAEAAACAAGAARLDVSGSAELKRATLCLLNEKRAMRGLRRLRLNDDLDLAARRHAHDMNWRNYFSHTSLGGASWLDRIRRTGYLRGARSWRAGENIAWGSGRLETPRAIVRAWMRSPGHRANILGRFHEVGIGIANGTPRRGLDGATYATSFGYAR